MTFRNLVAGPKDTDLFLMVFLLVTKIDTAEVILSVHLIMPSSTEKNIHLQITVRTLNAWEV